MGPLIRAYLDSACRAGDPLEVPTLVDEPDVIRLFRANLIGFRSDRAQQAQGSEQSITVRHEVRHLRNDLEITVRHGRAAPPQHEASFPLLARQRDTYSTGGG